MSFAITHPQFKVTVLELPVPDDLQASLICEHFGELNDVIQRGSVGNESMTRHNQHVKWKFGSTNNSDFIEMCGWNINFANKFNCTSKEICQFLLDDLHNFIRWIKSNIVSSLKTVTVDLARLTEKEREQFIAIAERYGQSTDNK